MWDGHDFQFWCSHFFFFLFLCIAPQCRYCVTEPPQYERSTSAETPGFFPGFPAESALIITVSPPKWRQRATAGGEELGFKQYRLQEVQPSLLVVDSDINSNEYLGALPDCLSMNCYHTWAWALEAVLCACDRVYLWCRLHTSVYLYVLVHCCERAPLLGQIWVICRITGSPKWPGLTGTINQNIVGALGRGCGFMLRLHLRGLELHWDPMHLCTMIFKWSMTGWTTFISTKSLHGYWTVKGAVHQKYTTIKPKELLFLLYFYQNDTPLCWKSVSDWTLQLIGLIWNCITTSLQFIFKCTDK